MCSIFPETIFALEPHEIPHPFSYFKKSLALIDNYQIFPLGSKRHTKKDNSSSSQFTKATKSSMVEKEAARTSVANDWTKSP